MPKLSLVGRSFLALCLLGVVSGIGYWMSDVDQHGLETVNLLDRAYIDVAPSRAGGDALRSVQLDADRLDVIDARRFTRELIYKPSVEMDKALIPVSLSPASSTRVLGKEVTKDTPVNVRYDAVVQELQFALGGHVLALNDTEQKEYIEIIGRLSDVQPNDVITVGGKTPFFAQTSSLTLPLDDARLSEYEIARRVGHNLIPPTKASFRNGLWSASVNDCSKSMPGEARGLSLTRAWFNRRFYATLAADHHHACTYTAFPVAAKQGEVLAFEFATDIRRGERGRFFLRLLGTDPKKGQTVSGYFTKDDITAGRLAILLVTSLEVQRAELYFYAPAENGVSSTVAYADPALFRYEPIARKRVELVDRSFVPLVPLSNARASACYFPRVSSALPMAEASFERIQAPFAARDCCATESGVPDIHASTSSRAIDGQTSLLLEAKNHCACVSQVYDVELHSDKRYLFTVRFLTELNREARVLVSVGDEGVSRSNIVVATSTSADQWQVLQRLIHPKNTGKERLLTYLYAYPEQGLPAAIYYDAINLKPIQPADIDAYRIVETREEPMITYATSTGTDAPGGRARLWLPQGGGVLVSTSRFSQYHKLCSQAGLAGIGSHCLSAHGHVRLNDGREAWIVENTEQACNRIDCERRLDGGYTFSVSVFSSVREGFMLALLVCALVCVGCTIWFVYLKRANATT